MAFKERRGQYSACPAICCRRRLASDKSESKGELLPLPSGLSLGSVEQGSGACPKNRKYRVDPMLLAKLG